MAKQQNITFEGKLFQPGFANNLKREKAMLIDPIIWGLIIKSLFRALVLLTGVLCGCVIYKEFFKGGGE